MLSGEIRVFNGMAWRPGDRGLRRRFDTSQSMSLIAWIRLRSTLIMSPVAGKPSARRSCGDTARPFRMTRPSAVRKMDAAALSSLSIQRSSIRNFTCTSVTGLVCPSASLRLLPWPDNVGEPIDLSLQHREGVVSVGLGLSRAGKGAREKPGGVG